MGRRMKNNRPARSAVPSDMTASRLSPVLMAAFLIAAFFTLGTCKPIGLKQSIIDMVTRKIELLSPDNEARLAQKTPELTWTTTGDAERYDVQLSVTEDFADPVTYTATEMKLIIPDSLTVCDIRYWRVRAVGADGAEGPWSETRSFEIIVSGAPKLAGTFNLRTKYPNANPFSIAVNGTYAYVPLYPDNGISIIDFSNPAEPKEIAFYEHPSGLPVEHIDTFGNYAYFHETDVDARLRILDVTNPAQPTLVGSSESAGMDGGKIASVGAATVAVWGDKVQYYDTTMPANIGNRESFSLPDDGWVPHMAGTHCYVVVRNTGLYIYDIYNRQKLGEYSIPDITETYSGVAGSGNYAYIAKDDLLIIDCSNPNSPQLAETYALSDYDVYAGIAIFGHYLTVGTKQNKFIVLDIRQPTAPVLVGSATAEIAWPEISGNYMLGAVYGKGEIQIVDLIP